jgi:hypothetical protein
VTWRGALEVPLLATEEFEPAVSRAASEAEKTGAKIFFQGGFMRVLATC